MNDTLIKLETQRMTAVYDPQRGGIISLKSPLDDFKTDFLLTPDEFPKFDIEAGQWLGNFIGQISYGKQRVAIKTAGKACSANYDQQAGLLEIAYEDSLSEAVSGIKGKVSFDLQEAIGMTISVKNETDQPIVVNELAVPFLMDQYFRGDDDFKYEQIVMRHTCITGSSSYLYWAKSSGNPPILLVSETTGQGFAEMEISKEVPFQQQNDDHSSYEGMTLAYILKETSSVPGVATEGVTLAVGEEVQYRVCLDFLPQEAAINESLKQQGLQVLKAVPGIVGPKNESFHIMTQPVEAQVQLLSPEDKILNSEVKNGWRVTEVRFGEYGRRQVKLSSDEGEDHYVFFVTEPVAAIIQKHAAFIAENHFETDPNDPCYHALLMWDMVNKRRINQSFNPYFEDWWTGGSDEPGLVSGLFLSEKNVYLPVEKEINVLSAYVEDFVLARLTEQPGWRVRRMVPWYTMFEPWDGRGADDVWRAFNYVHVINVMRNMYLIQKAGAYPQLRAAEEYLLMAYEYTKAMFNYWMFPHGVGASEFANMGEMTLPLYLQQELEAEGYLQEAAEMGAIFDKKAHFFDTKDFPFGSEMIYDSTAFEAVYGYGKRIDSEHIKSAAAKASLANRGKQPVWYLYNTDVRAGGDTNWNTSYMTQLGAYPLWDRSLNEGHSDEEWLMSYYGAYLSGWLIYNSGGYWDNDPANQGATGWITAGNQINTTGQPRPKGFPYNKGLVVLSGEGELGFFGALRTACSFVMDHSVLGRIGLGCEYQENGESFSLRPHDGLSTRFYHVPQGFKIEVQGGQLIEVTGDGQELSIHCRVFSQHQFKLEVMTIPAPGDKAQVLFAADNQMQTDHVTIRFDLKK